MTHDTTHDPNPNRQEFPQPPTLEIEDYREELAELDLSPEEEREVLEYLWHIVKTVVDAGFGLDAASNVLAAIAREVFQDASCDESETLRERKDP